MHTLPLALLSAFACAASAQSAAPVVVKIGHAAALTGGIAHVGKDSENGARLAIEEINAKGLTIGGKPVRLELDSQDDAGDPRTATQIAQKLVDDNVVAVVGHLTSGTSIPASRIYNDANVVQISPGATNPAFTLQGYKTTYRVVGTDAQQGPALAAYAAKQLGVKMVAVLDDSTAYGQGLATEFEKSAKSLGIKVVAHEATNDKAVDFRAVLTKFKGLNPDAIMYGGMDATGGPLAKQARQLGIRARILAGDSVCTEELPKLAGDAAANVVCSQAGIALEKMPTGAQFVAKYSKRFNVPVQITAPFSYDSVYIIVDAMKRANSTDRAKVLAAMPSTDYKGIIGETAFDSHGDLRHGVISLFTYKANNKTVLDIVRM
ncbi:branched chain amino acid ABC transporter substrate-binding protein [Pandoraea sp. ISTKB]|nr:branched chain amino acid ABC transporter substrate-binding protein [Pandoraea sp. ISTKB]